MGDLRTGKSYLMNALAKTTAFGVSGQARSFTKGVHVAPAQLLDTDDAKVVFVDMEGQKDKGMSYDLKLATPILLVSKVVVLNLVCPTGPSKVGILDTLEILMNAAKQVRKPKDRKALFGSLHIVLRDCRQSEDECFDIIFTNEDDFDADGDDEANAIKKRNDARSAVMASFESRPQVWCLPKLADEAPPDYRDASRPFGAKIDKIRAAVELQLASPKTLGGTPLTGQMIHLMMPELKKELNTDNPALNPPTMMEAVVEEHAKRIVQQFKDKADVIITDIEAQLPLDDGNMLEACIADKMRPLADQLKEHLADLSVPAVAKAQKEMDAMIASWLQSLKDKNFFLLEKKAMEEKKREEAELKLVVQKLKDMAKTIITEIENELPLDENKLEDRIDDKMRPLVDQLENEHLAHMSGPAVDEAQKEMASTKASLLQSLKDKNKERRREEADLLNRSRREVDNDPEDYSFSWFSGPCTASPRGRAVGTYRSTGRANGRTVYEGPRGGLFMFSDNGTKQSVRASQVDFY